MAQGQILTAADTRARRDIVDIQAKQATDETNITKLQGTISLTAEASANGQPASSGTIFNLVSLALTPGKWLIIGGINVYNGAATTWTDDFGVFIANANNSSAGSVIGISSGVFAPNQNGNGKNSGFISIKRCIDIAANTTYYLNCVCYYSGDKPNARGGMQAIRLFVP
jgi:hypothetical protein